MNRVAIVVLNYKGIEDTKACLASLSQLTYLDFTIVAVENGSKDGSADEFRKLEAQYGDKLVALCNKENLGFAGGVNTGIHWALDHNYDMVALFNNDATADPEWLSKLTDRLNNTPEASIATGLLLHEGGKTIDSTGDWYSIWGLPFPRNRGDHAVHAPKSGMTFGATGGATLYRAELFRTIGLFDDHFFAYYEDVDISFRTQLIGRKVMYEADALAYHKQGATSSKMPGFAVYQTFKNLPLLFWKNVPLGLMPLIAPRFLLAYVLIYGNTFTHRSGWPATKGLFKSLTLLPYALRQRRQIQESKRVSDHYIKDLLWHDLPPDQTGLRKFRRIFTGK